MKDILELPESEALIQGYLENSLTEDESGRLDALLRQEPRIADAILEGLRDDCLIRTALAEGVVPGTVQRQPEAWRAPPRPGWLQRWVALLQPRTAGFAALALAAGLVAMVATFWWYFGPQMGSPVLTEIQGTGLVLERSGRAVPAVAGTPLQPGDLLRTQPNATAFISFAPEKTRLTLRPGTELRLTQASGGKRFDLSLGKLEAIVARQRPFHPMILKTPQAEARVLGTRFTLTVSANVTRLEVTEGKVRFTRLGDGRHIVVPAGAYAVAAANSELAPLPLTGSILGEYWTNAPGADRVGYLLMDPRFPDHPSSRTNLTSFEAVPQQGGNYGAYFRGYIHPPVSGKYRFFIAASENGELHLSPDDKPEHRRSIAYARQTGPRQWSKHPGQESPLLTLVAGRRYYIEAMHKQGQGAGTDHLEVAWQPPGGNRQVIPGEFLSPFKPKPKEKKP